VIPSPLSHTKTCSGVFADALELLSHEERKTIRAQLSPSTISVDAAVDEVYSTAYNLKQSCVGKRWHWTYNGREIYLQDQANKILQLLDRFKSVGDVVANVDSIHVGLPWAGIRALLEVHI